ncbi:hypothetical protein [Nocardia crassostreae]|uniref:hypothetical protein n=1 Tax=Nocardia crassostreae TaxID=53428 RepID=UPI00083249A1|nr:hypothetical protein [Nocardia crassostreae]
MLKSYKKVSRWYPALEPAAGEVAPAPVDADDVLDAGDGPARYPHYIHDDPEPELDIPPVPDSLLRRSHFSGAWSDWMTDRESASGASRLRYRGSTVVEFPWESEEAEREPVDRATALLDAVADAPSAPRERSTGRRVFALVFLIVAILLLAVVGGVALYALNSHSDTSQSIGTLNGEVRSGPSDRPAAYNEMTATVVIGDHTPAGIPAG